jgi:DNA-binding Lrp family transcriptional regulator
VPTASDCDAAAGGPELSPLERRLLDEFQRDFPLVDAPFAAIAERLGSTEQEVIETLSRLAAQGYISRVGAVFAPRRIGHSVLAALAVPQSRLEQVAALVSSLPEVNHNYEREHSYNLWFVVAAPDARRVDAVLDRIEQHTGLQVLRLPLLHAYHIDLGFPLWR